MSRKVEKRTRAERKARSLRKRPKRAAFFLRKASEIIKIPWVEKECSRCGKLFQQVQWDEEVRHDAPLCDGCLWALAVEEEEEEEEFSEKNLLTIS